MFPTSILIEQIRLYRNEDNRWSESSLNNCNASGHFENSHAGVFKLVKNSRSNSRVSDCNYTWKRGSGKERNHETCSLISSILAEYPFGPLVIARTEDHFRSSHFGGKGLLTPTNLSSSVIDFAS